MADNDFGDPIKESITDLDVGREVLRIQVVTLASGKQVAELRRWYYDDNDDLRPTRKGVRFPASKIFDVQTAMTLCEKHVDQPTPAPEPTEARTKTGKPKTGRRKASK